MTINRHNYETYFLLYADNELPTSERVAVEVFVAENIDLTNEFELCKATILPNEELIFANKELLFKLIANKIYLSQVLEIVIFIKYKYLICCRKEFYVRTVVFLPN